MKKVKLFFPREMKYGGRVFEGGKVHEISEEVPGFITRWIKRGCTEVAYLEEAEPEKTITPFKPLESKPKSKPRSKIRSKKERVEEGSKEVNNIEETEE